MDSSINAFQIFQSAIEKLSLAYEKEEAAALVRWLMEDQLGLSRVDVAMKKDYTGEVAQLNEFQSSLERISKGEPIQYVLEYAEFLGEKYLVNSAVLIPRPETEELVVKICEDNPRTKTILDIGTGSGCIAIELAKRIKTATIWAWDVDAKTLEVASTNARNLNVNVQFQQVDALLTWPDRKEKLDLIVSNPPYIMDQEKMDMRENVLAHEPSKALFVPNEDPLLFYREIAEKSRNYLSKGGKLYFEINEQFGQGVVSLLQELSYDQVILHQDFQDKPRMIQAIWPG